MKYFVLGFLTAAVVLTLGIWFGRQELVRWASIGYETVDKPAVLLTTVELRQNGKEVGKIDRGTVVFIKGRAKDSPMEYISVALGWETRGLDAATVYRVIPKEESALVEMIVPKK